MDELDKLNQIKDKITNNKGIFFRRVPTKEWEWFTNWCTEEFEGDYGMGLKWLIQGYMPPEESILASKIEELESRIKELEIQSMLSQQSAEKPHTIKLLGGKELIKKNV